MTKRLTCCRAHAHNGVCLADTTMNEIDDVITQMTSRDHVVGHRTEYDVGRLIEALRDRLLKAIELLESPRCDGECRDDHNEHVIEDAASVLWHGWNGWESMEFAHTPGYEICSRCECARAAMIHEQGYGCHFMPSGRYHKHRDVVKVFKEPCANCRRAERGE